MTTVTESRKATARTSNRANLHRPQRVFAWMLLTPALLLFLFVFIVPIVYSGVLSMLGRGSSGGAYGQRESEFVGLANYAAVLQDPTFWSSLRNLGVYAVIMVPLMMATAILLALLLDLPRVHLRATSRTLIFLPYGVPSVIAALMWGFIYVPDISPISQMLDVLGIPFPPLLRGDYVLSAVINVVLWGGIGFNTIIIYTALQSLPPEQVDAARIDGCGEWGIARYVKLPHVLPATILTGLFAVINALQIYSEPQMLSALTPAINSTFFPLMRVYRDAFAHDDLNAASAASILLALLTVLLSLGVLGIRVLVSKRRAR